MFAYQRRGPRGAFSITENGRRGMRLMLDPALTDYVESAAASAELNVSEYIEALVANHRDRNRAQKRATAGKVTAAERAALLYVSKSHDLRKPADLRSLADSLAQEVEHIRLAATVVERDGEEALDRV